MVILFFATAKPDKSTHDNKAYSESMRKDVLKEDANKCVSIEISALKDLQVVSLDAMLRTSDDIAKYQHEIEGFLKIMEKRAADLGITDLNVIIRNKPYKIKECLVQFSWDEQKYPKSGKTIDSVLDKINDKFNNTKNNYKTKLDDYNLEIEKLKQKQKSELDARIFMKKDYREIISKKKLIDELPQTDFLTSLLVFVSISNVDLFKEKYQTLLADTVLPGSGLQLCSGEDDKVRMFRVVLMRHRLEEYQSELRRIIKANSKEFDPEEIKILPMLLQEQNTIEANIEEKRTNLSQSILSYYSEVYNAIIHLMYLRVYVEATLKYPKNEYHSLLVIPEEGKEQKIVNSILKKESSTENKGWYGTKEEIKDSEDFFPFVLVKLGVPLHLKD